MLNNKTVYFTNAATIRQLLEVYLKEEREEGAKG
jgi:hypothetical protein